MSAWTSVNRSSLWVESPWIGHFCFCGRTCTWTIDHELYRQIECKQILSARRLDYNIIQTRTEISDDNEEKGPSEKEMEEMEIEEGEIHIVCVRIAE